MFRGFWTPFFFFVINANSVGRNQPKATFIYIIHYLLTAFCFIIEHVIALTIGISVCIKATKTSFNSVPLCEIYPSKAKKYIDKIFKEKVRK